MDDKLRIVLLTGDGLRHRYVADHLASTLSLIGIVSEKKRHPVQEGITVINDIIDKHFGQRSEAEYRLLGDISFPASVPIYEVPSGSINRIDVFEWVRHQNPDLVVLYGTGIVKEPLLGQYKNSILNMHLGLSPYYRGAATNFWPLVDGLPECVGVTIHLAELEVDAGPVLNQVRPEIQYDDRIHEIGTRAIIAGTKCLAKIIPEFINGNVSGQVQQNKYGQLFRRCDFTVEAVERVLERLDGGMVKDYLDNKVKRDEMYPIVNAVLDETSQEVVK